MECESLRDKLDAYVDGELTAPEARNFGTHLRQCSECAADALARVQMKRAVSLAGEAYQPRAGARTARADYFHVVVVPCEARKRKTVTCLWRTRRSSRLNSCQYHSSRCCFN